MWLSTTLTSSYFAESNYLFICKGAWEVQLDPSESLSGNNQVMRQVVPVWPACWGYSCSGPTTYFGMLLLLQNGSI